MVIQCRGVGVCRTVASVVFTPVGRGDPRAGAGGRCSSVRLCDVIGPVDFKLKFFAPGLVGVRLRRK